MKNVSKHGKSPKTEPVTPKEEAPDIRKLFKQWIHEKFGRKGIIVLFVLGIIVAIWLQWDKVVTLPGAKQLINIYQRQSIPHAESSRYSIMVANLEDDEGNRLKRAMLESLSDFKGIQVLSLDRLVETQGSNPEAAVALGHARAKEYLAESGANVLLWGIALRLEGKILPRLYWTINETGTISREKGRYPLVPTDLSLPEVFWEDLSEVIRLLVMQQATVALANQGHFVADQLLFVIRRICAAFARRSLWHSGHRRRLFGETGNLFLQSRRNAVFCRNRCRVYRPLFGYRRSG